MLDTVEGIEGIEFAHSDKYGYVTSCPTNLGTGMRASAGAPGRGRAATMSAAPTGSPAAARPRRPQSAAGG